MPTVLRTGPYRRADERVAGVQFDADTLSVALMDGRTITVPLVWYPRLLSATPAQREKWQVAGGSYGIHWPEIDEDLNTEGLLPRPSTLASVEWTAVEVIADLSYNAR